MMKLVRPRKIETGDYPALYHKVSEALPGATLPWLKDLRAQAMARFSLDGFPSRRSETWRYTALEPLVNSVFAPALGAPSFKPALNGDLVLPGASPLRLVFVDGRLNRDLSHQGPLPKGLEIKSVGEAMEGQGIDLAGWLQSGLEDAKPLRELNTAFLMDGVILHIAANARIEQPIEIYHVMTAASGKADAKAAAHLHHMIVAGAGSDATIVESYEGEGAYWSNVVTDVVLERGAHLNSYKIQREGAEGVHLAETAVRLADEADYSNFTLLTGGQTLRNEIQVSFTGRKASCHLNGIYLTRAGQSHEIATIVDHATPDNISRQAYRGVLGSKAHAAFQGKVLVRQDAQRTNADQSNHNLVLHRSADINSKPELLIYADDVKCSHGATVGELDRNALFYLKARGIADVDARNLLIQAFIGTLIDDIAGADIQNLVRGVAAMAQPGDEGWAE